MAWSIVGVGTFVSAASGNLSPNEPSGCQEGDLLVAVIGYRSNAAFSMPSGWTEIEVQNTGDVDATNGIASAVMAYIIRGSSAPANTFTRTGGDLGMARIIAYRGNKTTGVLGAHSSNTVTLSATATTGTITTTAANSLIVAMCSAGDNLSHTAFDAATDPSTASAATPDTTTAPTAGTWLERADTGSATGADGALAVADAVRATAGATGTIQCTVSGTGGHAMIAAEFLINDAISGSVNATLDALTLTSDADLTIQGAVNATLGNVTMTSDADLTIQGSVGSTLAAVTLAATAQLTIEATLNLTLDPVVLTGESNTQETRTAALNVTLGEATLAATSTLGIDGEVNVVLGAVTLNAQGWLAVQGSLNVTLDNATLMAVGVMNMDEISVLELGWCGRRWPGDSRIVYGGGVWRVLI